MANSIKELHGATDALRIDVSSSDYTATKLIRAIRVTGAGDVAVDTMDGTVEALIPVGAYGQVNIVGVTRIDSGLTTCTGITLLF